LKEIQQKTLADHDVRWASSLDEVPDDAPLFLMANEFFDALPIRQYVKANDGWHERVVTADGTNLVFDVATSAVVLKRFAPPGAPSDAVLELSEAGISVARIVGKRVATAGGLALVIDYGHASALGDTFQAVASHNRADPLADPGNADLTAHVNFILLGARQWELGAHARGPVMQKEFLESLGIHARAQALVRAAPDQAADIEAAATRLTGEDQMGTLFKVMTISDSAGPPTGFPPT
jgi:NADH dehydrogenase [ubiquinone] 1 alpha subcomplex assembly factor 7